MKYNNFIFKFLLFGGLLLSSCNDVPGNTSSNFFKLETPKNIYVDNDNYIHWDKVSKAVYYNIRIMINNEYGMFCNENSSRNECNISRFFYHGEIPYDTPTELKISVMAKGNGGAVVDSDYSNEYVYTYTRINTEISEY